MDFDSLKNQVTNLTLYDLKAGFRKAQNVVLNLTEMEQKVREATNNEPWGASSSMMQEIANGTFNYAQLNEIMPMIYKRFTEKTAEEWRQIYKALQLLEFLIKNGSERVVDDARSHISLLKMLRQFHYIDSNGKDQGVNVRNRAKELGELLADVDRIRSERKKARTTRNKYGGHEGGAGLGGSSGNSRYGGFGSETGVGQGGYGGYSGGVYGDGGGFGGEQSQDDYTETQSRRERFEEYDEYDDGGATAPASRRKPKETATAKAKPAAAAAAKPKEPEVDLFDFGDDNISAAPAGPATMAPTTQTMPSSAADDDFDDFQSASPAASAPIAASDFSMPQPTAAQSQANNFNNIMSSISPPPHTGPSKPNYAAFSGVVSPQATVQQSTMQAPRSSGPNYFGSIPMSGATGASTQPSSAVTAPSISTQPSAAPRKSGADPFANLAFGKKSSSSSAKGPSIADLQKQKTSQGLWGANAPTGGSSSGDLI